VQGFEQEGALAQVGEGCQVAEGAAEPFGVLAGGGCPREELLGELLVRRGVGELQGGEMAQVGLEPFETVGELSGWEMINAGLRGDFIEGSCQRSGPYFKEKRVSQRNGSLWPR
jgi:hypothetical protein